MYCSRAGDEIAARLGKEIHSAIDREVSVHATIRFSRGSVLFEGVITVLGVMATIAGAVEFVQLVARAIRRVLDRVLASRAPGWRILTHVEIPYPLDAFTYRALPASGEAGLFSLRTILLAITLLNAVIFVGGSVYTGVSVTSIQAKYQEAEKEIARVRGEYEDFRSDLAERIGDIEGELRATGEDAGRLEKRLGEVSKILAGVEEEAQRLRTTVDEQRRMHSGWVSVGLVFSQASWLARGLLVFVLLSSACAIIVTVLALRG